MSYKIRKEKRSELQNGRTITYLSDLCGCSRVYLSYVLNGYSNRKPTKDIVEKIINGIAKDSVKVSKMLEQQGMEETIKYFFKEIK